MPRLIPLLFSLWTLCPLLTNGQSAHTSPSKDLDWKLIKSKSQISIYNRAHPIHKGKETKAVMRVQSTLNGLVALMKDSKAGTKWLSRIIVFKTFHILNQAEWYTYAVASLPFPYKNRDLVLYNRVQQFKDYSVKIHLKSTPKHFKAQKDLRRIEVASGFWFFTPLDNGEVEVTYQFYSEPHLDLPEWIKSPTIANGLITTMKNLRNKVKENKYQEANLFFIKEKIN